MVKIRLLIKVLENDTSEYMVVSRIVLNQDYSAVDVGLIKKVLLGIIRKIVFEGKGVQIKRYWGGITDDGASQILARGRVPNLHHQELCHQLKYI